MIEQTSRGKRVNLRSLAFACLFSVLGQTSGIAQPKAISQYQSVSIWMRPYGIEPAQVTVSAGQTYFFIQNHTTAKQVQLRLSVSGANASLLEVNLPLTSIHARQSYTLLPGTYVLSEASHPNWQCKILVK